MKPILKWAGGKRWLLPVLLPYIKDYNTIVEPFVGAGSVTFTCQPNNAVLADINPHLINLYKQLQLGTLTTSEIEFINTENCYYRNRSLFNTLIKTNPNSSQCALLFYYLNKTCFNGLCRFNKKGEFNVPYGKYKTIAYIEDFSSYKTALANYTFVCTDFESLDVPIHSALYLDPPYDDGFTNYSKEGFSWVDQVRLGNWAIQHEGLKIISNKATKRIIQLYTDLGFTIVLLDAPRSISSNGNRTKVQEVLAIKYE